jgi:hypothetical protein
LFSPNAGIQDGEFFPIELHLVHRYWLKTCL